MIHYPLGVRILRQSFKNSTTKLRRSLEKRSHLLLGSETVKYEFIGKDHCAKKLEACGI